MTDASACYPFATRQDFWVAAYANNHDEMGITWVLGREFFVNPQKRTLVKRSGMSALCHKQTYAVRQTHLYSITSSARSKIDVGIDTPIALAVFRLSANSKLVGCSTGRSDGFAPLRIFATNDAALRNIGTVSMP